MLVSQSEWFTSSCCPPDARDQQAHSPLAPGVCAIYLFGSSLVEFLSLFIYASPHPPQTDPPPLPSDPFFSKTDTGSEFKIDTQCKCHFPAWLSLHQLVPAHPGQSECRCQPRLGCLVSSPHRQRRLESTGCRLSSPLSAVLYLHDSSLPPSPVDSGSFSLFFSLCYQGCSWLPALPPRVLSVAVFCRILLLPVLLHCMLEH